MVIASRFSSQTEYRTRSLDENQTSSAFSHAVLRLSDSECLRDEFYAFIGFRTYIALCARRARYELYARVKIICRLDPEVANFNELEIDFWVFPDDRHRLFDLLNDQKKKWSSHIINDPRIPVLKCYQIEFNTILFTFYITNILFHWI